MRNPFDRLSEMSVDRPKSAIAVAVIGILALSSFAQFIVFDNSEDAFYPENETTDLLYEVEDTYTVDVDLVRSIVRLEQGSSLTDSESWELLAQVEYQMLTHPGMAGHHYGLFGGSANSGPASSVIFWQRVQDPGSDDWSEALMQSLVDVSNAEGQNLSTAVSNAMQMLTTIPSTDRVSADELLDWDPSSPEDWQARMDSGEDNADAVSYLVAVASTLMEGRNESEASMISPLQGQAIASLSPLSAIQGLDLRTPIMGMLPADSRDSPWEEADMALVTLALDTEPTSHGVELDTEVSAIVRDMVVDLDDSLQGLAGDSGATITVFSFSRFVEEQAGNLGAEIGILTSASIAILGIILWRQFRSVRDTGVVIVLTLLAIGATYGVSGIMRLEFNGAMNSIPILLLAIGVDYGLHVVLRYREELVKGDSEGKATMADFSAEARARALKLSLIHI